MVGVLDPFTSMIGMPAETLPMAMLRTLSCSGAYGLSSEIMAVHGAIRYRQYCIHHAGQHRNNSMFWLCI